MRQKYLKILFLGTQMETGGAQAVLFSQARYFHEKGYCVYTGFFYDKEGLFARWDESTSFPVINLKAWKYNDYWVFNFFRLIAGLYRLCRLMLRERFDVIETFTNDSNLLGIPLAWALNIPVRIATHHGMIRNTPRWRSWLHGIMVNSRLTTCLVLVANELKSVARDLEGVSDFKMEVIFNGVTLPHKQIIKPVEQIRSELGLKPSDVVVLSVGRLTEQKGHVYLLNAINIIKMELLDVKFIVVGDGMLRALLENKARSLRIDHLIKFVGLQPNAIQLLSIGDIFVMPSLWEGLSLALLEAMAVGMMPIVSNVEGVSDVIEDGVNGLVIPPMDAEALSVALLKAIKNSTLRKELGLNAQKRIERDFSSNTMCQKYETVFLEYLNREF